ncbi:MAG TPA: crosslink repair DNA glycosylase YcaQ family protein [Symbiobacteriaceae bacterium]|nr:crosslink repair DNA glycosylase YcaQ family protein [Symbiobacteriaceae bacterium]
MTRITLKEARRLFLYSQGLWPQPARRFRTVLEAIGALAGVQYDPNPVISQSHYMVLWNRVPGFCEADLDQAAYSEYTVLEGTFLNKNLFYVPAAEFHVYNQATRSISRWGRSRAEVEELAAVSPESWRAVEQVADCLGRFGPLTRNQIFERLDWQEGYRRVADLARVGTPIPVHEWICTPVGALRLLMWSGEVLIAGRIPGRFREPLFALRTALPLAVRLGPVPDEQEAHAELVRRLVHAYGITRPRHLARLTGYKVAEVQRLMKEQAARYGDLIPVTVQETGREIYWVVASVLEAVQTAAASFSGPQASLLTPLDNAVRDRTFLEALFGYTFEMEYFQKKGMRWQLSVLIDDEFRGFVDCKADRPRGRLLVRELSPADPNCDWIPLLQRRLMELCHYHGCSEVVLPGER